MKWNSEKTKKPSAVSIWWQNCEMLEEILTSGHIYKIDIEEPSLIQVLYKSVEEKSSLGFVFGLEHI